MLILKNVYKYFGDLEVLAGTDLEVEQGETVVICGPSGSGKSTLLRCVNKLEEIQKGEIFVDDMPIHDPDINIQEVREKVGIVFQQFNLFPHLTVLDNLTIAPRKVIGAPENKAIETAKELLDKVGIPEKVDAMPKSLSGGQKQRVAIARALAMNPKLMLFDEPTSALDPELIGGVLDVMEDLSRQGMTMAVVTHEMGFADAVADDVGFFCDGKIHEFGTPSQVIHEPKKNRTQEFMNSIGELY